MKQSIDPPKWLCGYLWKMSNHKDTSLMFTFMHTKKGGEASVRQEGCQETQYTEGASLEAKLSTPHYPWGSPKG